MVSLSRNSSSNYKWDDIPDPIDLDDPDCYAPALEYLKSYSRNENDSAPLLTKSNSFRCYNDENIEVKQTTLIEKAVNLFNQTETVAKALLIKFQWDFEAL